MEGGRGKDGRREGGIEKGKGRREERRRVEGGATEGSREAIIGGNERRRN